MDSDTKIDLVIAELKNICTQIDERFKKVDEKFEKIDARFDKMDERLDNMDARLDKIDERLDNMEENISDLRTSNQYEHEKIYNMLSCLNSTFLKFETEQKDTLNILLKGDQERQEHQSIYAYEFTRLNDLVAKNSFRISNLEKQHSET